MTERIMTVRWTVSPGVKRAETVRYNEATQSDSETLHRFLCHNHPGDRYTVSYRVAPKTRKPAARFTDAAKAAQDSIYRPFGVVDVTETGFDAEFDQTYPEQVDTQAWTDAQWRAAGF